MIHDHKRLKVYGTTKIAARGQIVLPIEARRGLKLKPGDTLMAVDCCGILTLMKPQDLETILNRVTERLQRHLTGVRTVLKQHRS